MTWVQIYLDCLKHTRQKKQVLKHKIFNFLNGINLRNVSPNRLSFTDGDSDTMPKEIINMTLERKGQNEPWGFVIIGGKDQVR